MHMPLFTMLSLMLAAAGCNGGVYLRDGVTDGDTFYLAERAMTDTDPVLQSWAGYSLARSACQLQIGGDNPARESSFDCEFTARRLLLETWLEQKVAGPGARDDYLDELTLIATAGYLAEYVAAYFGKRHWELPYDLETAEFRQWRRSNLRGHRAQTRIVGSWNYAHPPLPRTD